MINCKGCTLYKQSRKGLDFTNFTRGTGNRTSKVMVIFDTPFANDLTTGKFFSDTRTRELLNSYLRKSNLTLDDIYITSLVKCYMSDPKKKPTKPQKQKCFELHLQTEIELIQPKIILLCGTMVSKYFVDGIVTMKQAVGTYFYSNIFKCYCLPLFNFYYLSKLHENAPQHKAMNRALTKVSYLLNKHKQKTYDIQTSSDYSQLQLLQKVIAIDLETTGLNFFKDRILTISISDMNRNLVFDLDEIDWNKIYPEIIKRKIIAHNAGFEIKFLKNVGLDIEDSLVGDTKLMQFLLNPLGATALGFLTQLYFGFTYKDAIDRTNMIAMESGARKQYCATDTYFTIRLFWKLLAKVKERGSYNSFKVFMRLIRVVSNLEYKGIKIDVNKVKDIMIEYQELKDKYADKFKNALKLSEEFNVNSSKQLREVIYNQLRLPITIKTKSGQPSTNAQAVEILAKKKPSLKNLVEYRTYKGHIEKLSRYLEDAGNTCTIHSEFSLYSPDSSRIMSRRPNCYDDKTEILTDKGWVLFKDLYPNTKVFQCNQELTESNFIRPLKIIKQEYTGELLNITNRFTNLCVTPNHRCLIKPRNRSNSVYSAKNFPHRELQFNALNYSFGKVHINSYFLDFILAYQADGWLHSNNKDIQFGFVKTRKINKLRTILQRGFIEYTESTTKRGHIYFYINRQKNIELFKILNIYFINLKEKTFVLGEFYKLHSNSIDYILTQINFWDGRFERDTDYSSNNKLNSDTIQILYTLRNKRALQTHHSSNTNNFLVSNSKRNTTSTIHHTRYLNYTGNIYCVVVPMSFIIVRRNGKVTISGNTQNVPRGSRVKEIFVARKGCSFVYFDYSSLEFRVWVCLSKDTKGIEFIKSGKDIHKVIASRFLRKAEKDITKSERDKIKSVVYGSLYGSTPEGVALLYDVPLEEAKQIQRIFFNICKKGYFWMKSLENKILRDKYIKTPFGTYKFMPDINLAFGRKKDEMIRSAKNFIVQSWGAELVFIGLYKVYKAFKDNNLDAGFVHSIHDAGIIECKDEDINKVIKIVKDNAVSPYKLSVPLDIEIKTGKSWADLKEITLINLN